MSVETFSQSLWSSLAAPGPFAPALAGEIEVDVLIVGAGFLGLSTALHLAETGVKVALLEAAEVGFGASGRNTGFVVPSLRTSFGPEALSERLGHAYAERLTRLVAASGKTLFDLVERIGIDCAAEPTGWLQPAHTAAVGSLLEKRVAERRRLGSSVVLLDAWETARRIGATGYYGALFDPTGGQINPLAYARGLAKAGMTKGVALYQHTPVTTLVEDGKGWRAGTPRGSVRASRVLLTTNALTGRLMPALADSIIPARVHQIATEVLPKAVQKRILIDRTPVADTRRHTFAVRWSPDGRLVTGGLVMPGPRSLERATAVFTRRLARFFPDIGPIRAEFVWNGVIAATIDALPRFLSLGRGLDAAIGCNGRGVALTTSLGREIAELYSGKASAEDFPLPHLPPRPVPGRRLAEIGPYLWLPWSNLRDRLEAGR